MKEKIKFTGDVTHIISEPGDRTRYDYLVIQNYDDFYFVPWGNSFEYPPKLNRWEVKQVETLQDAEEFCIEQQSTVNPYTMLECVRTIKELT